MRYVIFTDLDGTLLDHHTYSYQAAEPALARIRATATPLVMVSSKTRTELEALRAAMANPDPFIVENGGAVFIPRDYDLPVPAAAEAAQGYLVLRLGRRAAELAPAFDGLAARFPVKGLSRLPVAEIVRLTGLRPEQAQAARRREFGEAFVLEEPERYGQALAQAVAAMGLRLTRGGRFWHLLGANDKGRAVALLAGLFRERYPGVVTVGCGDAPNDAPMLAAVDQPFLVARPDGQHHAVEVDRLIRLARPGPAGFNEAVLSVLGTA